MKIQKRRALFLVIAMLILLTACDANRRYAVLSFFFDGVPRPESKDGAGTSPGSQKASLATAPSTTFYQHGPYAARLCDGCHEPSSNQLVMPKEELCLFCHTLSRNKKKMHGPLAAGGCTVCHDPHSASNRAFLVADAREFCLFCHERGDVMKRAVHQGAAETCTACHDAHGADNDFLLKALRSRNNIHSTGLAT